MTGNAPSLISGYIILEQLNGPRLHRPDSLRHNAAQARTLNQAAADGG